MQQEGAPAGRSKTAQLMREAGIESKATPASVS
ncbi:hypothetical protein [Candidatus Williamhamiltonella defendens]